MCALAGILTDFRKKKNFTMFQREVYELLALLAGHYIFPGYTSSLLSDHDQDTIGGRGSAAAAFFALFLQNNCKGPSGAGGDE